MPIQSVNLATPGTNTQKRKYSPVKITGYTATALGVASGVAGANKKLKLHRVLAYLAGAFTAWHIGLIEFGHKKRQKNNPA